METSKLLDVSLKGRPSDEGRDLPLLLIVIKVIIIIFPNNSYNIDTTPVTNAQFEEFVRASGYATTAERNEEKPEMLWRTFASHDREDHPVVNVSWYMDFVDVVSHLQDEVSLQTLLRVCD